MRVKLKDLIAPSFYGIHRQIKRGEVDELWLKGGRGSTKSTFSAVQIILGMMKDPNANAVIFRKVKDTLKDSVYEQLMWVIEKMNLTRYWNCTLSPLRMSYKNADGNTQQILFRGLDKAEKTKSIKTRHGYFKYIWFEELNEFRNPEEIRSTLQSVERGGSEFLVIKTYNPFKSQRNWVNTEVDIPAPKKVVHHSTYLGVPEEWLGERFITRAEHLKKTNLTAYEHEYLGEVVGTGGQVFTNITAREIAENEIRQFDRVMCGIDWGYSIDPFVWIKRHYDSTRRRLYIYDEIFKVNLSNIKASEIIKIKDPDNTLIISDSAEPKSIADISSYGHRITGAKKGANSIEFGIKFLQDLEEIIIDPARCPNTYREFIGYEYEEDRWGGFKSGYPDKDNHTIDAVRYSMERDSLQIRKVKVTAR